MLIDGILPKMASQRHPSVLKKSLKIWQALDQMQKGEICREELFMRILRFYGSRAFLSELIGAAIATQTEYMICPYASSP